MLKAYFKKAQAKKAQAKKAYAKPELYPLGRATFLTHGSSSFGTPGEKSGDQETFWNNS